MIDHYLDMFATIFAAAGRGFSQLELEQARKLFGQKLSEAFAASSRSNIVVEYGAVESQGIQFKLAIQVHTVSDAYENWLRNRSPPLFGIHADARVLTLAENISDPKFAPVLDIGAGTGRNSIALARRGHPVDAVELTPKFAQMLLAEASKEKLVMRVIQQDVFQVMNQLRRDYRLIILSEVVSDFRNVTQLRQLFELAAEALAIGGELVFNAFLAMQGYTPERSAREFSQQCYSTIFTRAEIEQAATGLPLKPVSDESVHDFEKENLPEGAWPPTGWYEDWVLGLDIYGVKRNQSPVEMRWLVFRKPT
jgi:16S rRNA G527 N7-methylase RsmG